jgi:DNA-binding response OmpR family regulator
MQSILIVEDNKTLANNLAILLRNKNYLVKTVFTFNRALEVLEKQRFDLVVLDRHLPDGNGLDIISILRDKFFSTRILVLTYKSQVIERIRGLEKGADDYLGKPFSAAELLLRIKNLLMSFKLHDNHSLAIGSSKFYPESGLFIKNNKQIKLRKKESAILFLLIKFTNQVVDRQAIKKTVWFDSKDYPKKNTVDVYVRRLRMTLGNFGGNIKTIRGFGYQLNL